MRFFDSCAGRVTLADVAEDIANDIAFEKYLKKLHENKEREKAHNRDKGSICILAVKATHHKLHNHGQQSRVNFAVLLGFFHNLQIVAVNISCFFGNDDLIPVALGADNNNFLTAAQLVDNLIAHACSGTQIQTTSVCHDRSGGFGFFCDSTIQGNHHAAILIDGIGVAVHIRRIGKEVRSVAQRTHIGGIHGELVLAHNIHRHMRKIEVFKAHIPDSAEVSKLVHGRMRPKLDQIVASIEGITTPLQRKLLAQIIDHIDDLNRRIGELDKLVQEYMTEYEAAIAAIDEIPGIARRSAEVILAEIGLDMSRFPSAAHLCSWAGVCPGNYQSAGKRKHGKTTKGNSALKTILTQCAKSARSTKNSYFSAQYQRIAARRGKNRATLAVAHSILIAIYHILKNKAAFHDLGADYYDSFNRDRKINSYLKRLKALGWEPDAIPSSA